MTTKRTLSFGRCAPYLLGAALFFGGEISANISLFKIVDGNTLYLRERIEIAKDLELSEEMKLRILQHLSSGSFRLVGVKLEPFEGENKSEIGEEAMAYIKARVSKGEWFIDVDDRGRLDDQGIAWGYLINERGEILNEEIIRKGYTPYFYKNGISKKYHVALLGAEREAFYGYVGIWKGIEKREYYYWERQKWAKDLRISIPSWIVPGKIIEDVGEDPTRWEIIQGCLVVLVIFILGNHKKHWDQTVHPRLFSRINRWFWKKIPIAKDVVVKYEAYIARKDAEFKGQAMTPAPPDAVQPSLGENSATPILPTLPPPTVKS